jgi:hypothetical protein
VFTPLRNASEESIFNKMPNTLSMELLLNTDACREEQTTGAQSAQNSSQL